MANPSRALEHRPKPLQQFCFLFEVCPLRGELSCPLARCTVISKGLLEIWNHQRHRGLTPRFAALLEVALAYLLVDIVGAREYYELSSETARWTTYHLQHGEYDGPIPVDDQGRSLRQIIDWAPALTHRGWPDGHFDSSNVPQVRRVAAKGFAGLGVDRDGPSRGCRRNRGKVPRVSGQRRTPPA